MVGQILSPSGNAESGFSAGCIGKDHMTGEFVGGITGIKLRGRFELVGNKIHCMRSSGMQRE